MLAMALAFVVVPAGAGAAGRPRDEEVTLYQPNAVGQAHLKSVGLNVFPGLGVAVAFTVESDAESENGSPAFEKDRGVGYAVRIPKGPLDGRLDIHFPGIGRLVGRYSVSGEGGCSGSKGTEEGSFRGHIDFRGSGGYGRWTSTHALVSRNCPAEVPPAKTLLGDAGEYGPSFQGGSNGPFSFLQAVDAHGHGTGVIFTAEVYGRGPEETLGFTVSDYEWLHGGMAAMRWASLEGVPREDRLEIAPGGRSPAGATVHPPAPFSGEATYSRKGGKLLGELSVHLPGRTVRIAGPGAEASLSNYF